MSAGAGGWPIRGPEIHTQAAVMKKTQACKRPPPSPQARQPEPSVRWIACACGVTVRIVLMRRFLCLLMAGLPALAQKSPFDVNAMMKLSRISDPQISPDGKQVAFTVQTIDIDANKKPRQIWIVGIEGGNANAITSDGNNERARWMSNSRLAFISDRAGSSQVWSMNS